MRFNVFITLTFIFLLPFVASAQALGISTEGQAFTISMSPSYPQPYGQVTISLLSSVLDLSNATMGVSVDGKNIYQGSVQPVTISLGGAGTITSAKVTVTSVMTNYDQTISIQPQDVVAIVEPISSAPPLYPGKSLVPLEGGVRVVAMANFQDSKGKMFDPSVLSYSWTVDGTRIADSSGIGKMAIMVASPFQYRSRSVSVVVMSQDGSLVGGDDLSLTTEDPLVRIYKNDPLLGILYDHALSDQYTINDAEDTLFAAPFSFPTTNGAPLLQWFLSGEAVQTGNSITLRPTGSGEGTASLSLVASAEESTRATESLSILFGSSSGTGFFGL